MKAASERMRGRVMGIFAELRRRSILRVAGVYVVVAWLVAQVAVVLETSMGLPGWFDGAVVAALFLGFPIALVIAWAFELTPEGIRRSGPATNERAARPASATDVAILFALAAVLGVSVFQAVRSSAGPQSVAEPGSAELAAVTSAEDDAPAPAPRAAEADSRASIAVLPFTDMSAQGDQEYFADGLSEELLNRLAQIDDLRVIGRTSSFAFKGRDTDLREIGDALGVAHLLEGSVRKSGDQLRITAQLIDAADGSHVWSQTYDRTLADVFAIQEDISSTVARELSVALGVGQTLERAGGTDDVEAYDLYLRAEALRIAVDHERALELFREALAVDPDFTRARAGLAVTYMNMLISAPERAEEIAAAMERVVSEALALAPGEPDVQLASAVLHMQRQEWAAAERAFERVRRVDPTPPLWGIWLLDVGRVEDAIADSQARLLSSPLSLEASAGLQQTLTIARRFDDAEAEYRRSQDLSGATQLADHAALMRALILRDDALVRARMERLAGGPMAPGLFETLRDLHPDREALAAAARAAVDDPAYQDAYRQVVTGFLAAEFGDTEKALAAMRRAFVEQSGNIVLAIWYPNMAAVRREPGFKDLVRDVGLVDYWRASGNWGDFCRPLGEDDFECS